MKPGRPDKTGDKGASAPPRPRPAKRNEERNRRREQELRERILRIQEAIEKEE